MTDGQLVALSAVLPDTDLPEGTVTLSDAHRLAADLRLYGNAFVKPSGEGAPTHVRIPPDEVITD